MVRREFFKRVLAWLTAVFLPWRKETYFIGHRYRVPLDVVRGRGWHSWTYKYSPILDKEEFMRKFREAASQTVFTPPLPETAWPDREWDIGGEG